MQNVLYLCTQKHAKLGGASTIGASSIALMAIDLGRDSAMLKQAWHCSRCSLGSACTSFAAKIKYDDVMTAITINIPNHEVSFFKKMIKKMGWTYSEADVVRSAATPKEQALAKVDHAFGQLRQMKDGELQGINAEDLLNEL